MFSLGSMIEFASGKWPREPCCQHFLMKIIYGHKRWFTNIQPISVCNDAVVHGHVECIKQCSVRRVSDRDFQKLCNIAATNDQLDALKYLLSQRPAGFKLAAEFLHASIFKAAARVVAYLIEHDKCTVTEDTLGYAVQCTNNTDTNMLELLIRNCRPPIDRVLLLIDAARVHRQRFQVLETIYAGVAHPPSMCPVDATSIIEPQNVDVVKFFVSKYGARLNVDELLTIAVTFRAAAIVFYLITEHSGLLTAGAGSMYVEEIMSVARSEMDRKEQTEWIGILNEMLKTVPVEFDFLENAILFGPRECAAIVMRHGLSATYEQVYELARAVVTDRRDVRGLVALYECYLIDNFPILECARTVIRHIGKWESAVAIMHDNGLFDACDPYDLYWLAVTLGDRRVAECFRQLGVPIDRITVERMENEYRNNNSDNNNNNNNEIVIDGGRAVVEWIQNECNKYCVQYNK